MKNCLNKFNFSVLLLSMCAVQAVEKNEKIIPVPEKVGAHESGQGPNDSQGHLLLDLTDEQREEYVQTLEESKFDPVPYDPDMETIFVPAPDQRLEQDEPTQR